MGGRPAAPGAGADDAREDEGRGGAGRSALRRTVLVVAALNFGYALVEGTVALSIGSVSLLADAADFLEDTALNLIVFAALGWAAAARSRAGKVMALLLLIPSAAAAWQAVMKAGDPVAPDTTALLVTAGGAALVNLTAALLLVRQYHHGGSMGRAAWLSARNDVLVNLAIIVMGVVTLAVGNGWPDLVLGVFIILLGLGAAREVWEAAEAERPVPTA